MVHNKKEHKKENS